MGGAKRWWRDSLMTRVVVAHVYKNTQLMLCVDTDAGVLERAMCPRRCL